jgi:hypothetical protein
VDCIFNSVGVIITREIPCRYIPLDVMKLFTYFPNFYLEYVVIRQIFFFFVNYFSKMYFHKSSQHNSGLGRILKQQKKYLIGNYTKYTLCYSCSKLTSETLTNLENSPSTFPNNVCGWSCSTTSPSSKTNILSHDRINFIRCAILTTVDDVK